MSTQITVVVPVFEGLLTLDDLIQSLQQQSTSIESLIFVLDGGRQLDATLTFLRDRQFDVADVLAIVHRGNLGLAASYNSALPYVETELCVFVHQDMHLPTSDTLEKLVSPFADPSVVAVGHISQGSPLHESAPMTLQLALLLSASYYKEARGWNGQLDAVRTSPLLAIGGFDETRFITAGEDGDMVARIREFGKIAISDASGAHLDSGTTTSWRRYFDKRYQYSQALGALVSIHGRKAGSVVKMSWRACVGLGLLSIVVMSFWSPEVLWLLVVLCLPLIPVAYTSARLTKRMVFFLPGLLIELVSTPISACGFLVGFLRRKSLFRFERNSVSRAQTVIELFKLGK